MSKDKAKLKNMSDEELLSYYEKRVPLYRRALARLTSLIRNVFGRLFKATAASTINISGGGGGPVSGSGTLQVDAFRAPSQKKLQEYIDVLDQIDFIEELGYFLERAKASGTKVMMDRGREAARLYNAMVDAYETAIEEMTKIAEGHVPDSVGALFKEVSKILNKRAKAGNENEPDYYLHVGVKGDDTDFVYNADLTDWARTTEEDKLLLVTTVRVTPESDSFRVRVFVNVLDRIALPFKYSLGTEIQADTIAKFRTQFNDEVENELALHDVAIFLAPVKLKIDPTELETALEGTAGLKGIHVQDDRITFEIPEGKDQKSVIAKVVRHLNSHKNIKKLVRAKYTTRFERDGDSDIYVY